MRSDTVSTGGRVLASVETPLQLLNLCALLETDSFRSRFDAVDLVVFKQFELPESLRCLLENRRLFDSVTPVEAYYAPYGKKQFPLFSLMRSMRPREHYRRFGHHLDAIPDGPYDVLVSGCASIYAMDLKQRFVRNGQTVFYEEGEGSYLGNFVKSAACYDRELLVASKSALRSLVSPVLLALSGGRLKFDAHELYLYRPELVDEGIYRPQIELRTIAPLGSVADSTVGALGAARDTSVPLTWAYLGNPDADISAAEGLTADELLERIARTGHELLYRKHPRSRGASCLNGLANVVMDDGADMWELKCLRGDVTDDSVLFGFGSTAQTNPVRMFGIKPTLVFLHRFMAEGIDRTYAELALKKARVLYGDAADKIMVPNSLTELDEALGLLGESAGRQ